MSCVGIHILVLTNDRQVYGWSVIIGDKLVIERVGHLNVKQFLILLMNLMEKKLNLFHMGLAYIGFN